MVLEINELRKSFGEKEILKGINLKVESGTALGLLGRNGAGKTTTIRIIMGIILKDSGQILLDGKPLENTKVKIGYLPEERGLYPKKSVLEQMVFFGEIKGLSAKEAKKSAIKLLEKLEADEYINRKLETLSKGNQQKIQLAISLIDNPDIIILDEPFSGLDPVNSSLLKKLVYEKVKDNKIVFFSSHQMSYVEEFCKNICIMNNGEIVLDGNLSEIKRSYEKNKIAVETYDNPSKLNETLQNEKNIASLALNIEQIEKGSLITLRDENDKDFLFKKVADLNLSISKFKVVEPSLEEIFVEMAGDSNASI